MHCIVEDCNREHKAKGYCELHYGRFKRHGDPLKSLNVNYPAVRRSRIPQTRLCQLDGCNNAHLSKGLCRKHYKRFKKWGDPNKRGRVKGQGHVNKQGYVEVVENGKKYRQHRRVMEDYLGRPLVSDETVHHKNGVRSDNRIENLELRVGSHGQGILVEDALAWADEIIKRYRGFWGTG